MTDPSRVASLKKRFILPVLAISLLATPCVDAAPLFNWGSKNAEDTPLLKRSLTFANGARLELNTRDELWFDYGKSKPPEGKPKRFLLFNGYLTEFPFLVDAPFTRNFKSADHDLPTRSDQFGDIPVLNFGGRLYTIQSDGTSQMLDLSNKPIADDRDYEHLVSFIRVTRDGKPAGQIIEIPAGTKYIQNGSEKQSVGLTNYGYYLQSDGKILDLGTFNVVNSAEIKENRIILDNGYLRSGPRIPLQFELDQLTSVGLKATQLERSPVKKSVPVDSVQNSSTNSQPVKDWLWKPSEHMKPAVDSQVQPTVQLAAAAEPAADVAPIPPAPVSPAQNSSVKIDSADRAQRLAERNARVQAKEYKRGKTPLVPDENGQLVSAETVVSQHFPDLRHEISNSSMVFDFDEPEDLKKMIRSLNKVQSKNLVILGEGGSGKTEMVRSFVKAVMNGQVPSFPPSTPFLKVEAAAFEAGGKSAGMIPARINALIKYAQSTGAVIFLDEIHSLKSVGTHSEESNGLFQKIKTAMADGSIRVIGTSTVDEFNEAFGDDEALLRRFQKIVKEAPSMEKSVERMTAWTKSAGFEPLNKELYEKIFTLSEEFDAVGSQPAKAIRLLDEVLTLAKLDNILEEEITTEHLHQAASELYSGIDKSEFDPHFRQKRLNNFQSEMNHRVMGMDQLKEKLFRITKRALAQTHDTGKPRLRVLLPGAKGLGKSHIAASYAKSMGLPYERINMADYAAGKTPEELLGRIKSVLSKHPMTVINFDEVEKAHPSVQNALLELMESDFIKVPTKSQNGSRRYTRLRVSGASIFMTTNAGQDYVTSGATIEREALEAALKADGLSEFLFNRVQVIEPVQPPRTAQEFQSVVRFKLKEKLAEISKKHEVQINLAPAQEQQLLDRLTKEYFHPPGQAKQVTVQTAAGPKAISVTTNYRKAAEDLDDIVGTAVSDVIDHSHVARSKCISLELDHLLSR